LEQSVRENRLFFVGFVCISTAVMLLLQERTHLVNEV